MLAILVLILPTHFSLPDIDGDGYSDVRELLGGCNPFDPSSFPTCQHGEPVACSTTEPGFTPPPEPC